MNHEDEEQPLASQSLIGLDTNYQREMEVDSHDSTSDSSQVSKSNAISSSSRVDDFSSQDLPSCKDEAMLTSRMSIQPFSAPNQNAVGERLWADELVEWAKDEAFRKGIAGWRCGVNDNLSGVIVCSLNSVQNPFQLGNTVNAQAGGLQEWMERGEKHDSILANDETAKMILNMELDFMLTQTGVPRYDVQACGENYLLKVKILDKWEYPKRPGDNKFIIKVLKEAAFNPDNATSGRIELATRYVHPYSTWDEIQDILDKACYRFNDQDVSVPGRFLGNWKYREQDTVTNLLKGRTHILDSEQWGRLAESVVASPSINERTFILYQDATRHFGIAWNEAVNLTYADTQSVQDNLAWQILRENSEIVAAPIIWDQLEKTVASSEGSVQISKEECKVFFTEDTFAFTTARESDEGARSDQQIPEKPQKDTLKISPRRSPRKRKCTERFDEWMNYR